jgi:hypothetical protein
MVPHAAPLRQAHSSTPTTRSFRSRRSSRARRLRCRRTVSPLTTTKPGQQSARGFASSGMAHHRQNIGNGVTLTRVGGGETGQPFREDRALAARRVTTPFPDPEPYDDRNALHRQVVEASLIPAMLPLGDDPTGGTSWHQTALGLDEPAIPNPADRVDDHGWVRRTDALLCHERHSTPRRNLRRYHH